MCVAGAKPQLVRRIPETTGQRVHPPRQKRRPPGVHRSPRRNRRADGADREAGAGDRRARFGVVRAVIGDKRKKTASGYRVSPERIPATTPHEAKFCPPANTIIRDSVQSRAHIENIKSKRTAGRSDMTNSRVARREHGREARGRLPRDLPILPWPLAMADMRVIDSCTPGRTDATG